MPGDRRAADTRHREPSVPIVRIPIMAQMEYASSTSSGSMNHSNSMPSGRPKKHSKRQHDVSIERRYTHQPSEERQATSSPMERETFLPTRDNDVSERREAAHYQQDELANHYYAPQPGGKQQQRSNPQNDQRASMIPRPYDYRASSPAPHQVSYHSQSPHNTASSQEHSNSSKRRKNKAKSSSSGDMKMGSRNADIESHSQHQQQQDGYSDNGSKKSKRSLLSRASKQLKKKLVKDDSNHDFPPEGEFRDDEGSPFSREARDPSPTIGTKSGYHNNNSVEEKALQEEGDWVYSGSSPNHRADYQGLIQAFPSLGEFSSGSTITTACTNQLEDVVISPRMSQVKSMATMSPIMERQKNKMIVHVKEANERKLQRKEQMRQYLSSKDEEMKHLREASKHAELESEVDDLRNQLALREEEMENETTKLREELRKQKQKLEKIQGNANTKINEYAIQVERDLEAYKGECSVYRERLLQKERENAKMEQALYNERKKVLSLEAENEMLMNAAEERVGNAINLEKAKSSELKSYMEQCENYRDRVLGLESKVMSMEGALNATSSIAATVEEEKNALSSELNQAKANMVTIKSEIGTKDAEISSLRSDVSSLESKCSKLEATLKGVNSKASDDKQSIVMLEDENASLLEQLKEKSLAIEKLQTSADLYKQIEDENASLKRKNDELIAKALDLKEELSKSEVFSSNTERLKKMLADSEAFISALQTDLSSARTNHHQQLTDVRAKYSSEIDGLTTQLEKQIAAKRELETKNNDLANKTLSLERKVSEVEDKGTHQAKAQSDQLLKMIEHADVLRKKLSESSQEVSDMKCKLESNEQTVVELRSKIKALEGEKSAMSDNVNALQGELHSFTTEKTNQIKELQKYIKERDDAFAKHESVTLSDTTKKLQQIERLNATIEDLKKYLKDAEEENDLLRDQLSNSKELLRKQASDMKRHFFDAFSDLRVEKSSLMSDVQSLLLAEKALLEKKVKEMALDCRRKLESDYLNKAMLHQASMSSLHSQMKGVEKLLSDERKKTQQLESTLQEARRKKEDAEATIKAACSKLGRETRENDLVDAIDDLMIEGSQAESKIITLNIDIKTLNSTISSLEYDKEQLSRQMRLLSERKEKEIDELKRAFDSDRKAQDASTESLIASKEEKLQAMRAANDELKGQIEKLSEETVHLQKCRESCEAELKECQGKVSAAKEESVSLKNKLSEAKRDYQDKANNLAEHYMKIEDELRTQLNAARHEKDAVEKKIEDEVRIQLNTVRLEKESAEKKLAAKNKETDRLMDDFYSQKQELTSRTADLIDKLDAISSERDSLQRQEELLKSTIATKESETKELEKCVENLKDQLECAQNEARKREEMFEKAEQQARKREDMYEKAEQQALSLREVVSKYSKDLESAKNDLEDSKRVCDSERIAHANAMSDQQSTYESELEKMLMALEKCKEDVEVLTFENSSLEESVVSLTSRINNLEKTKSKQTNQIVQLKASLNEALEEALRLGSKIDAEEMRHLEITQTLSLVQEENNDLKQSLTGVEHDKSSFNERLDKLSKEKNKLQQELSIKEKQLFEALNSLTHFELKLAKAEQERDRREQVSENAHEEIKRLQKATASLESENEELTGQILILQQDSKADSLYKELLHKMKVKDIQREEEFHDMNAKVDSLKARLATVTQQKNHLEAVNNEKISSLQSSLASIKQQLLKKQRCSDDASSTSSKTSKSHLKQMVVELEDSVDAIKNHYENKVRTLQHALNSARKKMEKYERKISDLTTLLEENASVVDVLHKKLKMNNRHQVQETRSPVRSPKSEETVESEVSS